MFLARPAETRRSISPYVTLHQPSNESRIRPSRRKYAVRGGCCGGKQTRRALIGQAVEKFGRIDCLFNNAGGPAQTGGIEGLDASRFDLAMATLVRSVMLGMKHAAPHMRRQGSGSIINNGSIAGRLAGFSSSVVYGAAKAAVIHLTKCVAMELSESNIRVNSISPGAIATGILAKARGVST